MDKNFEVACWKRLSACSRDRRLAIITFFNSGPGTLAGAPLTDKIGNLQDTRAGLAVFRIVYSDGSQGILNVSNLSDGQRLFVFPE